METNEYINSGLLELFVAGKLSDQEMVELAELLKKDTDLLKEVLRIEKMFIALGESVAPDLPALVYAQLTNQIAMPSLQTKVIRLKRLNIIAWAAILVLVSLLTWTISENQQIRTEIAETIQLIDSTEMENQKIQAQLADKLELINQLREPNLIIEKLGGQGEFEQTFAKVYWNKNAQKILIDAKGLPEPPEDQEYQVWSLTLNPLTPTSLGLLKEFNTNDEKIFSLENQNESQAFGITLEPKGGSDSPTMEQLYVLGIVTVE